MLQVMNGNLLIKVDRVPRIELKNTLNNNKLHICRFEEKMEIETGTIVQISGKQKNPLKTGQHVLFDRYGTISYKPKINENKEILSDPDTYFIIKEDRLFAFVEGSEEEKNLKIIPLNKKILIKTQMGVEQFQKWENSNLLIPQDSYRLESIGKVVDLGPFEENEELGFKLGQEVFYDKFTIYPFDIMKEEHVLLHPENVHGICKY